MSNKNECSNLQRFFVLAGKRMVKGSVKPQSGDAIKAQIASAAINLKLPFDFVWRVWHGRCGQRAFLRLYEAWSRADGDRKHDACSSDIVERLERVESSIHELAHVIETISRDHAGDGGGTPHTPSVALSPA